MDILETILTVACTIAGQSVLFIVIGNKFLKVAFDKVKEVINPTVAKAFGILGGKSGDSRRNKALEAEVAGDVINATVGKFKPILGMIGIDVDDLIDRYGAMEVLSMVQTFLPMLKNAGIDVSKIMGQFTGEQPQTSNSELGNIGT